MKVDRRAHEDFNRLMVRMLETVDFQGNSYLGVFATASETLGLLPLHIPKKVVRLVQETLNIDTLQCTLGSSSILGTLACMNSQGIVTTNFIENDELAQLEAITSVTIIDDKFNAAGNNILINDHAALIHPELSTASEKLIADTLDVEIQRGTIASLQTVGAAAIATNTGVLCHPKITPEELDVVKDLFGVPVALGTANYGVPLIGACIIANSKGALAGMASTGIELGRIEDALGLI